MDSFIENKKVVPIYFPKDGTGAAMTTEYVNMKNYKKATWILMTGTQTSTSNAAVKIKVADDASGTHSKSLSSASAACTLDFPHYYKAPTSSVADVYTKTSVSSSTFNIAAASDSKVFIIEVDAEKMGTFVSTSVTYSADWVALTLATPGAHASLRSCVCILSDPRYASDAPPTAIS
jgi:hypothetical protein